MNMGCAASRPSAQGQSSGQSSGNSSIFLYTGQANVPKSVTHVRVDRSVKGIGPETFQFCELLEEVELFEGLRTIEGGAFAGCTSLKNIKIPSTVREIVREAFLRCEQLVNIEICRGLECIDEYAFSFCKSLKRINIPSSVKKIGAQAFDTCIRLEQVGIRKGLAEIGDQAFKDCKSLRHIKIPASSVKKFRGRVFIGCDLLEEVELFEGAKCIWSGSFSDCESIKRITIPSTAKMIGAYAFHGCDQLQKVLLCEPLTSRGKHLFLASPYVKPPPATKVIEIGAFGNCHRLMGVELCSGSYRLYNIGSGAFRNCFSLRNIALPSETASNSFEGCYDLLRLFGSQDNIQRALKSRFDGLPIHELCYHQANMTTEASVSLLKKILGSNSRQVGSGLHSSAINSSQDCMGMTSLHILACSTKQNSALYQMLVDHEPNSLIAEDKWGCPPILYAIWGGASQEIIHFLVGRLNDFFPNASLNWNRMIETMCRAGASLDLVKNMLQIQQGFFMDIEMDWYKIACELIIRCLVECGSIEQFTPAWEATLRAFDTSLAYQKLVQSLLEVQQNFFPDGNHTDLQPLCEELIQPLKGWYLPNDTHSSLKIFHLLVKCDERLIAIGVKRWRLEIMDNLQRYYLARGGNPTDHSETFHAMLMSYEEAYRKMEDKASWLELAVWKTKISEFIQDKGVKDQPKEVHKKSQCRINCGANVIIPNVLVFLTGYGENGKLHMGVFDVFAPAGRLGVVIDTPNAGAPVVHAVKATSPIADRVNVGDKIVAVDDEDVREMSAIQLSRLISQKSNNVTRKLTFFRRDDSQEPGQVCGVSFHS